jgi:hypothetical protein
MVKSVADCSEVFRVSPDDFNFELPEPDQYYQTELNVTLKIYQQPAKKSVEEGNIFKNAEFWCSKGCLI